MLERNAYLVATDDVDDDEHVGHGNEPSGLAEGHEDVVFNGVSKDVVADECDREVAHCHNDIGHDATLPHGSL